MAGQRGKADAGLAGPAARMTATVSTNYAIWTLGDLIPESGVPCSQGTAKRMLKVLLRTPAAAAIGLAVGFRSFLMHGQGPAGRQAKG